MAGRVLAAVLAGQLLAGPVSGLTGAEAAELVRAAMLAAGQPPAQLLLAPERRLPACASVPGVEPDGPHWAGVILTCDQPRWSRHLRLSAEPRDAAPAGAPAPVQGGRRVEVVVLRRALAAGTRLSAEDLMLAETGLPGAAGALADPQAGVGRILARALAAGQPLHERALEPDWLVPAGTPLVLRMQAGAIEVSVAAEALGAGRLDDVIEVRNTASGRTLPAIVRGRNFVVPVPNMAPVSAD